jgi:hypothetical protein
MPDKNLIVNKTLKNQIKKNYLKVLSKMEKLFHAESNIIQCKWSQNFFPVFIKNLFVKMLKLKKFFNFINGNILNIKKITWEIR